VANEFGATAAADRPSPSPESAAGHTTEEQLAALLAKAYVLADGLSKRTGEREVQRYEDQISGLRIENSGLEDRCNQLIRQHAAMVMLFVSSERLHASLESREVATSIWEILVNLVGAEEFCIAVRDGEGKDVPFELVRCEQVDEARARASLTKDPLVTRALEEGNVVIATEPATVSHEDGAPGAIAAVPLRMTDASGEAYNLGVIVVFKLLDHKRELAAEDGDVLSLLGGHAATAFVGANAYARLHRKVRTMESLMNLLKK